MNKNEIEIRRATVDDDFLVIASILYLADPYVYPPLFDYNTDNCIRGLVYLIRNSEVFRYERIILATYHDTIIGVLLYLERGVVWNPADLLEMFKELEIEPTSAYEATNEQYFNKIVEFHSDYYLLNVSVLPNFRRNGVCRRLLGALYDIVGEGDCILEAVCENENTIKLYESEGFIKKEVYPTFCLFNADLKSYHMYITNPCNQ